MQLTNLNRTTIGKNVLVDDNVVVIVVPSLSRKIWNSVYQTPFLMSNCKGIVIPNKIFKINKKAFNGRVHYLEAKKQFVELKNVIKKIPVVGSLSSLKPKNSEDKKVKQFFFYDLTIPMNGISHFMEKLPERKIFQILIDELRSAYKKIKSEFPNRRVMVLVDVASRDDLMYHFLVNFRQIRAILKDSLAGEKFFDGFMYTSINQRLIPVLEYDKNDIIQPILPMISKLDKFLESSEFADEIAGAPAISDEEVDSESSKVPNKSIVSKIVDTLTNPETLIQHRQNFVPDGKTVKVQKTKPLSVETKVDPEDEDKVKIELDGKTLSKVMKYYKVTNPDIIANVKAAIDDYIKETGAVPTKANAELLVLKAVSKSVHGTDEINETYLSEPNLLFDKLKEVNVFSVPLEFPKQEKVFPFEISDVVTLKATTGQHRQQYEFTELDWLRYINKNLKGHTAKLRYDKRL